MKSSEMSRFERFIDSRDFDALLRKYLLKPYIVRLIEPDKLSFLSDGVLAFSKGRQLAVYPDKYYRKTSLMVVEGHSRVSKLAI